MGEIVSLPCWPGERLPDIWFQHLQYVETPYLTKSDAVVQPQARMKRRWWCENWASTWLIFNESLKYCTPFGFIVLPNRFNNFRVWRNRMCCAHSDRRISIVYLVLFQTISEMFQSSIANVSIAEIQFSQRLKAKTKIISFVSLRMIKERQWRTRVTFNNWLMCNAPSSAILFRWIAKEINPLMTIRMKRV